MPDGDSLEKFLTFQREVNRLFRRIFEEGSAKADAGDGPDVRADVSEREDELVVEVELPGARRDSLALEVSRDLIVVEGEKPTPRPDSAAGPLRYHAMERSFGRFRRVIEIPVAVDTGSIRARYAQGLLTIVLPKIALDRRGERRRVAIDLAGDDEAKDRHPSPSAKRKAAR